MARPTWQIEVPFAYLSLDEQREVENSISTPVDPEEALEVLETSAEVFSVDVVVRLHDLHLSGVQISFDLAGQIAEIEKELKR